MFFVLFCFVLFCFFAQVPKPQSVLYLCLLHGILVLGISSIFFLFSTSLMKSSILINKITACGVCLVNDIFTQSLQNTILSLIHVNQESSTVSITNSVLFWETSLQGTIDHILYTVTYQLSLLPGSLFSKPFLLCKHPH